MTVYPANPKDNLKLYIYFSLVFLYNLISIIFLGIFMECQTEVYKKQKMKLHLLMLYCSYAIYGYFLLWSLCQGLSVGYIDPKKDQTTRSLDLFKWVYGMLGLFFGNNHDITKFK